MKMRGLLFILTGILLNLNIGYSLSYDKNPKGKQTKRDVKKWSDWIDVKVDEMEGDTTYKSKDWITISNSNTSDVIFVWMEKEGYNGSIDILFNVRGSGNCIDDNNRVIILFRDKTKIDTNGISKFNCNQNSWFSFEDESVDSLKSKEIDKIRVYTVDGSVQLELTQIQSKEFLTVINHLIDRK
jgi:hypothetical protein